MTEQLWPDGRKVAVLITVALESWSPGHWPVYAPMAVAWPLPGVIDTHSASWSEYGVTTGIWRLLDLLADHRMPATVGVSGLACERAPEAVLAAHAAGHEIAAHSYAQDIVPAQLDPIAERADIERCTAILETLTGTRPVGWMSPRATASASTADLLAECGYRWSGDHSDRDLPRVLSTSTKPLVAIMHGDLSDVRGATAPRSYLDTHVDLLDDLLAATGPGVFPLTVHAHVGGRPLLSGMVDRILDHIDLVRDQVWITTRHRAADHVLSNHRAREERTG